MAKLNSEILFRETRQKSAIGAARGVFHLRNLWLAELVEEHLDAFELRDPRSLREELLLGSLLQGVGLRVGRILFEKTLNLKLSGNELYYICFY